MIEERPWTFRVSAETRVNEVVCIVGSCSELGGWDPCQILPLTQVKDSSSEEAVEDVQTYTWTTTLQLPMTKVGYRYCVAVQADYSMYAIRRWETHFNHRTIEASTPQTDEEDVSQFGVSCGQRRVEAGWLVYDTAVQLKLCNSKNNPPSIVFWKKKHKDKKLRVKVTPVPLGADSTGIEDSTEHGGADSRPPLSPVSWPLLEVAVLKEGLCNFAPLKQFGVVYNEEDFTVFQSRLLHLQTYAYLFDFYVEESSASSDLPRYIGCSYLLPSNLLENFGITTIPITSPRNLPIGQLTVHYMVVKPMPLGVSDMSASFTHYWKKSWKGLEVGHRGAGNSYHSQPKSCATIRENTVASFKYAAENGADMVEFDLQLSRDLVPVIYHDFHACIALKRKKEQDHSDLLEIPIKDLTLEQLQALKDLSHLKGGIPEDVFSYCDNEDMVYHKKEKGLSKFSDEDFEDHQPFPTLEKSLKTVPYTCGFNIEVKWTMLLKDGTYELQHPFELNNFLDLILKVVLEHGGRRKIVFSCFHPDICTMLRLKQNRYPVLFLTQGMSTEWPPYDDIRCQSIKLAVMYSTTADILGINLHTEDLLRDASQMELALNHNLIVFCWGDRNNDKSTIAFLKELGMHAIIYDKIDVYNSKAQKESIFLCEERESLQQVEQYSEGVYSGGDCGGSPFSSYSESTPSSSPSLPSTSISAMLAAAQQQV